MVEDPPAAAVKRAANLIDRKDAPILAAAMEANVDYLITLDKKHFLQPKVRGTLAIAVCSPADFLKIFERLWLTD